MDQGNKALQGRRQCFGEGTSPFGHPAISYSRERERRTEPWKEQEHSVLSSPLSPYCPAFARRQQWWISPFLTSFNATTGQLTWFRSSFYTLKHCVNQALGIFWASLLAQLVKNLPAMWETWVRSLGWDIPWRRESLPTPVFWPGEFHGLYSQWGRKESDTTERLSLHFMYLGFVGPYFLPLKRVSRHWCPLPLEALQILNPVPLISP